MLNTVTANVIIVRVMAPKNNNKRTDRTIVGVKWKKRFIVLSMSVRIMDADHMIVRRNGVIKQSHRTKKQAFKAAFDLKKRLTDEMNNSYGIGKDRNLVRFLTLQ